jgi:hypothetical protein
MVVGARSAALTRSADDVPRLATSDVVAELVTTLGARIVAYLGGVSHTKFVRTWTNGKALPRGRREAALRGALQAVRILLSTESAAVAQAWFIGANRHLGLEAPASVLRDADGPDDVSRVVRAASAFVS